MATVQAAKPIITPLDRFGLTLSLAILFHALLILGITFSQEDRSRARFNSMEIVLVQQKSAEPEEAKMLAQANLEGGGNVDEPANPSAPMPAPFPDPKPNITMPQPAAQEPAQPAESATTEAVVEETSLVKKDLVETLTVEEDESPTPMVEKVDAPSKEKKNAETNETQTTKRITTLEKKRVKEIIKKPIAPTATELLTNSFKIASLSAEIRRKMEAKAERPRRKFISASTKEYNYAAYMEAWRSKVERVGNLNYPEQARKQGLSGSLVLDVALRRDGTIDEITIRRSSGEKMLDDAAIRIVRLSAPFSPFPQHIKDETDILHIMRTWQFLDNRGFK